MFAFFFAKQKYSPQQNIFVCILIAKKDIFSIVKTSGKVRNVPDHSATAMQIMIVYKLSVINNNLSK